MEILITIGYVAVWCGSQKFPADFAVWCWIGFCFIALHPSSTKSGIYSSRWNFRRRRILRIIPRARATAKLLFVVAVVAAAFFVNHANGCKMRKFSWISPTCHSKITGSAVQSSIFTTKKTSCHDILLHRTYSTISRTSRSAQRDQSKSRLINSFPLSSDKRENFLETFAEKIMCLNIADS